MLSADVRLRLYQRLLETGIAPSAADLAHDLNETAEAVSRALAELEAAHALVLAPTTGTIWMAHPFSSVPTDYRVSAGGRSWWANCAWDALGIAVLLDRDADIRSRCACCAEPIAIAVRGGALHGDALIHFVVPPRKFWENVAYT